MYVYLSTNVKYNGVVISITNRENPISPKYVILYVIYISDSEMEWLGGRGGLVEASPGRWCFPAYSDSEMGWLGGRGWSVEVSPGRW